MTQRNRLGDLQMRVTRHHRAGLGVGAVDQGPLQAAHFEIEAVDRIAQPQPQIGCDLVIARPRGMKAPRHRPDQLSEARLDVHVNVFVFGAEHKAAAFNFRPDLV